MIPTSNPLPQHQLLKDELEQAVIDVMRSGNYILGPQVEAFESEAANFLNVRHTVSCASGTDALLLSMKAFGIQAGATKSSLLHSASCLLPKLLAIWAQPRCWLTSRRTASI